MRNIEAKFRLRNTTLTYERAAAIGFNKIDAFTQRDTFFAVRSGKLKLREQAGAHTTLIHYRRERRDGLDLSNYHIVMVADGDGLRKMLADSLGVIAEVRKHRVLMMRGNIRLHFDKVENLGEFGELEAVLEANADIAVNQREVREILAACEIHDDDLIAQSYFELSRSVP
ncbi:MAG: class IV adenylate cyclase [Candidatus Binataceae bacterium]